MTYLMNKNREDLEAKRKKEELKKKEDDARLQNQTRLKGVV